MSQEPRSWAAGIVGFALALLAAAFMLRVAACLLWAALPVLIPTAAVMLGTVVAWRWWTNRIRGW